MPIQPRITDEEFQDIRIIDLDLSKTTWSRVHETLRVMFLRLDRPPPDTDWSRLFFEERDTRIVARRRGLWIEENYISFDSLPDEVEKIHLPDIRLSIAYANRKYRELALERRLKRQEDQAGQRSERDEMLALRARVRGILDDPSVATALPVAATPAPVVAKPAVPAAMVHPAASPAAAPVEAAAGTTSAVAPVTAKPVAQTPMVAKAAAAAAAAAAASEAAKSVAASIAARASARSAAASAAALQARVPAVAAAVPVPTPVPDSSSTAATLPLETTPAATAEKQKTATDPAPAAVPAADALAEFRLRRDALKQRFRHAAVPQDKEQNNGND